LFAKRVGGINGYLDVTVGTFIYKLRVALGDNLKVVVGGTGMTESDLEDIVVCG
jgi:hypothetical protein